MKYEYEVTVQFTAVRSVTISAKSEEEAEEKLEEKITNGLTDGMVLSLPKGWEMPEPEEVGYERV